MVHPNDIFDVPYVTNKVVLCCTLTDSFGHFIFCMIYGLISQSRFSDQGISARTPYSSRISATVTPYVFYAYRQRYNGIGWVATQYNRYLGNCAFQQQRIAKQGGILSLLMEYNISCSCIVLFEIKKEDVFIFAGGGFRSLVHLLFCFKS